MNPNLKKFAIPGLRWTLCLVVLLKSIQFAFSSSEIHHFARMGFPQWIRLTLAGGEIVAALLFLVPAASVAGGYLLLIIFALAALIHVLHGDYDVGALLIYFMAVIVCMAYGGQKTSEAKHER
ncbi:MAG: DoxX family protein [Candidatus Acidiferrales bacterium]